MECAIKSHSEMKINAEFIIENVRCFRDRLRVPLRPITFLVGENSTGKTTFMGCYNALRNLWSGIRMGGSDGNIFNQGPFSMGAYGDIVARSRPGMESFCLGIRGPVDKAKPASNPRDLICYFRKSGDFEPTLSKISSILSAKDELHIEPTDKGWIRKIDGTSILKPVDVDAPGMEHFPPVGLLMGFSALRRIFYGLPKEAEAAITRHFDEISFKQMLTTAPLAIAPVRFKPKRTYDPVLEASTPEGDHVPYVLARMFREGKKEWENLRKELVSFGKESQLFSDIDIRSFGKQSGDPFQLLIKARGPKANIMDVGYGVSQILPLLVDTIRSKERTFLLQQPEVHLHPKGQAALANLFAELTKSRGHSFLIETHSDYIVDRMRVCVRKGEIDARDVVILYFAPDKNGGVKIHPIELDEGGQIKNPPPGYRDFFIKEIDRVLGFPD